MATRTKAALAANVLVHLGITNASESPAAIDVQYVSDRYDDCLEELIDDDLAYWPSNAIPVVMFEPLTQLVSLSVMTAFGLPLSPTEMEEGRRLYKRRIRRHVGKKSSGLAAEFEDF